MVQGLVLLLGLVFPPCPEFEAPSMSTSRNTGAFQGSPESLTGAGLSAREAHAPGTATESGETP